MLTNKMHSLNERFNSILPVSYMFRTSYVHYQEGYIVHAVLYVLCFPCVLSKKSTRLKDVLDTTHGKHTI